MPEPAAQQFSLGIDLGTNSLGWAIIALIDDEPASLVRCGVRVFPAGVVNEKGVEKSRNLERRRARSQRRQTWRRARRLTKMFHLLQRFGLLPAGFSVNSSQRQELLERLDTEIRGSSHRKIPASAWFLSKENSGAYPEAEQVMPYILRASALDEELPLHFLGRALYHLSQRRGFLSNRKKERSEREAEEKSKMAKDMRTLEEKLQGLTLGQYLASQSPMERAARLDSANSLKDKVRRIWTMRRMYQDEFDRIWTAQAKYHPSVLTEARKKAMWHVMFDQRGPKKKPSAIGKCEFEPAERRAPAFLLISQRFRMLQAINNVRVWRSRSGEQPRPLNSVERDALISLLERAGDADFKKVREVTDLVGYSFNLQKDKDHATMPGDNTGAQFYGIFGEVWLRLDPVQRERTVADACSILSVRDERDRAKRAEKYLRNKGLQETATAVEQFLKIEFEDSRVSLSEKAMNRFLPLLEAGFCFGDIQGHYRELEEMTPRLIRLAQSGTSREEVCRQVLVSRPKRGERYDALPSLRDAEAHLGQIRNPIVLRSLTELRKVVNAVVRKFGRPAVIRVELARELKNSKEERERILKENNKRERSNSQMIAEIRSEAGVYSPGDLTRYKLWLESKDGKCPYCTEYMSRPSLFVGGSLQVDHIIPRGRLLDDSFTNLVLCHAECNQRKADRTPSEAFGGTAEWDGILARAKNFGDAKLRRFKMAGEELDKFCHKFRSSQLNDTAYASRAAGDYLGLLFGGRTDTNGNLCVQVTSGGTTKFFREIWKLDGILNDGPTADGGKVFKTRDDHRHHAVDAAVVAVTDPDMVSRLNNAAKYAATQERFRRESMERYASGPLPGVNFRQVLREQIDGVIVSHRVSRKVSGPLHRGTNYSPQEFGPSVRRHRIELKELSEEQVKSDAVIADKGVRELIRQKLESLGINDPAEAFADDGNFPRFVTRDGRNIPIKKVRIQETVKTRRVGEGWRARYVKPGGPGGNHHVEIFGRPGPNGADREWATPGVVTMLEAYNRVRNSQPVVRMNPEPGWEGWEFRFSLAQYDTLVFDSGPFKGSYFVVRSISEEEKKGSVKIEMVRVNDARQPKKIKNAQRGSVATQWITKSPNELRKLGTRRVIVNPIGDISEAHD